MNNDRKNFIWNTIGLTINAFTSLFYMVIVNRINDTEIAGVFSYAFSISILGYFLATYYSRTYQIANYNNSKSFNDYMSFRLIGVLFAFLLSIGFCLINGFNIFKASVLLIFILVKCVEALCDCIFGLLQEQGELYKVGISYSLKGILTPIIFLVVDLITKDVVLASIAVLIVTVLVFIFYDLLNAKKYIKYSFNLSNKNIILLEAAPIFVYNCLSIYCSNMPKYIIEYFANDSIQNVLGIIIMPATMLSLVGMYLIIPFITKFKKLHDDKNKAGFSGLSKKILIVFFGTGVLALVVCYFIGIPVLNIIYGLELGEYRWLLEIIILGAVFNAASLIVSNLMVILNDNRKQLFIYVATSIVFTVIGILLIKNNSITGAAISYCLEYGFIFICYLASYIIDLSKWKKIK